MNNQVKFSFYDAFTGEVFGGSQAGIIQNDGELPEAVRQKIAFEIGAAATGFVSEFDANSISVRFHSKITEYPMCGHGTVCLITEMLKHEVFGWAEKDHLSIELKLLKTGGSSTVEVYKNDDGSPRVMLDIVPPKFINNPADPEILAELLSVGTDVFNDNLPMEVALGDFNHLVVPVRSVADMNKIAPSFSELSAYCIEHNLQTVACFCLETVNAESTVHMRDFCPAVGVDESAAAGTTNAALATYMYRNQLLDTSSAADITIRAEQGIKMNRPSMVQTQITHSGESISRLQVGGRAVQTISGTLYLSADK